MKNIGNSFSSIRKVNVGSMKVFFIVGLLFVILFSVIASSLIITSNPVITNNKAATIPVTNSTVSNLKYYGYFNVACGNFRNDLYSLSNTSMGSTNIVMLSLTAPYEYPWYPDKVKECLQYAKQLNIKVILDVYWYFFSSDANGLVPPTRWPDYSKWDKFKSQIAGFEDIIYAFYLDEPGLRYESISDFRQITQKIRTEYPSNGMFVFEGYPIIENVNYRNQTITSSYYEYVTDFGFDWYTSSNDIYGSGYTYPDWTPEKYDYFFQKFLKLTNPNQKLWLVPQTLSGENTAQYSIQYDRLIEIMNGYYNYAKHNSRIVGLINFIYTPFLDNQHDGKLSGIGALEMTDPFYKEYNGKYADRLFQIGKEITSNTPLGINVALNSAISSSSDPEGTLKYATDGTSVSYWNSKKFGPQSITLNLKKPYDLEKIRLNIRQDLPGVTTHKIYADNSANPTTLVYTLTGNFTDKSWQEFPVLTKAQYIKVETTSTNNLVGWSEIEAYENTNPPAPTTPPPGQYPTGTINFVNNQQKVSAGQEIQFTATFNDIQGRLGWGPTGRVGGVYAKAIDGPADGSQGWITIKEPVLSECNNNRTTCTLNIKWTPTEAKSYYIAINSYTNTSAVYADTLKCTGNPVTQPSIPSCGPNSYITATVLSPYLSDMNWKSATVGFSVPTKNQNLNASGDKTIKINGVAYTKGLVAHANSDVRYDLNGEYKTFTAKLGIEDQGANTNFGSVTFQVWGDGIKLYDSSRINGNTPTVNMTVNVTGVKELKLVTTDAGDGISYDESVWADAKILTN